MQIMVNLCIPGDLLKENRDDCLWDEWKLQYSLCYTHISFCEQDMKNDGNRKKRIVLRRVPKELLHGWTLVREAEVSPGQLVSMTLMPQA